ncbi:Uncharacterised protein [Vibrio cholerae]|nr:Uncharacterised protein [Vibrio cholerae]CSH99824.1 Uncharacterised protein [Vibrio cholerae]CSI54202.1 Uncharacterised protein [Vibrio cholerae]
MCGESAHRQALDKPRYDRKTASLNRQRNQDRPNLSIHHASLGQWYLANRQSSS